MFTFNNTIFFKTKYDEGRCLLSWLKNPKPARCPGLGFGSFDVFSLDWWILSQPGVRGWVWIISISPRRFLEIFLINWGFLRPGVLGLFLQERFGSNPNTPHLRDGDSCLRDFLKKMKYEVEEWWKPSRKFEKFGGGVREENFQMVDMISHPFGVSTPPKFYS